METLKKENSYILQEQQSIQFLTLSVPTVSFVSHVQSPLGIILSRNIRLDVVGEVSYGVLANLTRPSYVVAVQSALFPATSRRMLRDKIEPSPDQKSNYNWYTSGYKCECIFILNCQYFLPGFKRVNSAVKCSYINLRYCSFPAPECRLFIFATTFPKQIYIEKPLKINCVKCRLSQVVRLLHMSPFSSYAFQIGEGDFLNIGFII